MTTAVLYPPMPMDDLSIIPGWRRAWPVTSRGWPGATRGGAGMKPGLEGVEGGQDLHRGPGRLAVPDQRLDREDARGLGEHLVEGEPLGGVALGGAGAVGVHVGHLGGIDPGGVASASMKQRRSSRRSGATATRL